MSDVELIARLRTINKNYEMARGVHVDIRQAADRIEQLVATNEALVKEMDFAMMTGHDLAKMEYRDLVNDLEARAEQLAATNKRLEAALKRVLRNVDEDGVGTVLMIDLIHARAALKGADHE